MKNCARARVRLACSAAAAAALFASAAPVSAATISIAPSDSYSKVESARAGDIVEIQPGTYQFRVYLSAQGTAAQPIVYRAADPNNRPIWDLAGRNVEDWPGSYTGGDRGRGCWQIAGSFIRVSGIVLRNCHTASGNGAGIRTVASNDVVVRDVLLEDNDVGFSGDGENTALEFSELSGNGRVSNPPQHSIYIFGGSFALRYSYVHDSVGGQNLHIRARDSVIENNWIARAANYEADMMPGSDPAHSMLLRGNVFVGNATPGNGGQVIVLFNDSGNAGVSMRLTAIWNTIVLRSGTNPALVNIRNNVLASASLTFTHNIVVGTRTAYALGNAAGSNVTVSGSNNWFETGSNIGLLSGTIFGSAPGFQSASNFRLAAGSPALGAALTMVANPPDREYFENETNARKFRVRGTTLDLGAFESTTTGPGYGPYDNPVGVGGIGGSAGAGTGGSGGGAGAGTGGSGATAGSSSGGSSGSGTAGSAGTGGSAGGRGSAGSAGKSNAGASSDDSGGCGCRLATGKSGVASIGLLLALCGALRRRRRGPS